MTGVQVCTVAPYLLGHKSVIVKPVAELSDILQGRLECYEKPNQILAEIHVKMTSLLGLRSGNRFAAAGEKLGIHIESPIFFMKRIANLSGSVI